MTTTTENATDERFIDVHTEHCCEIHGCKYNYEAKGKECTVTSGKARQSFMCENCRGLKQIDREIARLNKEREKMLTLQAKGLDVDFNSGYWDIDWDDED